MNRARLAIACALLGGCHLVNDLTGYEFTGEGGGGGQDQPLYTLRVRVERLSTPLEVTRGDETLIFDTDGSQPFTTPLAAGESFAIELGPLDGQRCTIDPPSGTMASADLEIAVLCTPIVRPQHPEAPRWLDYLAADGLGPCDAATVTRPRDCLHGGEKRAVYVPGAADCNGVSGQDHEQAFVWTCHDEGERVELRAEALAPGKGLAELIDRETLAFLPNAVDITTPSASFSTDLEAWWDNPVRAVDGAQDAPGTIYLVVDDSIPSLVVGADRVAILTDLGAGQPPVVANGRDFVWVEGSGAGDVVMNASSMAVLRNLTAFGEVRVVGSRAPRIQGLTVSGGATCLQLESTIGAAVEGATMARCQRPFQLDQVTGGLATRLSAASCVLAGLVSGSSDFALDDVTLTSFEGPALTVAGSERIHLSRLLIASTDDDGLRMDCTDCSVVAATAMLSTAWGFRFNGGSLHLSNLLAVANGSGMSFENGANVVGRDWVAVSSRNGLGTAVNVSLSGSQVALAGVLKVGGLGMAASCAAQQSSGIEDVTCAAIDQSSFTLQSGNAGGLLGAKVTQDDGENPSDTAGAATFVPSFDWFHFERPTRFWGQDGGSFPDVTNQGACSATSPACRIWDARLRANGAATQQAAVPTPNDVTTFAGQVFLVSALEILDDGLGDDDGYCESQERCLHLPNAGAYQGHGALEELPLGDGAVMGVELWRFADNGD